MGNIENRFNILSDVNSSNRDFLSCQEIHLVRLMFLWFSSLFSVGLWRIRSNPIILRAFNPYEAISYLIRERRVALSHIGQLVSPVRSLLILCCSGGVFLSVTGCEALFADLGKITLLSWPSNDDGIDSAGHFGLWPVRTSWFLIVLPSVMVNYLGQGAFLINHPESIENPCVTLCPCAP